MQVEHKRRIWRPRLRLSVRSAMILILVLAAWLGLITHRARAQHEAVAAVRKGGGHVVYEGRYFDPRPSDVVGFFRPRWLVNLVGIDYLCNVTEVSLDGLATDAHLIPIGRLPRLEHLSITRSPITDAGLRHLQGLRELRKLYLHVTLISDRGLVHLSGMDSLQLLTLVDTKVTDEGLPMLSGLCCLQELDLPPAVSNEAIQHLQSQLPSARINQGLPHEGK
jgi:hypothetical protein